MHDVMIYVPDINNILLKTQLVLQTLRNAGARLNKDKSEFEVQNAKYLGHIVTSDGIMIERAKNQIIDRIKAPTSKIGQLAFTA